jgi:hypothetical protein
VFHDWLANERYSADAAAFDAMTNPTNPGARAAANSCREVARAYADAFR